jgi:drug/metabolite transporter (DMT)-like permease
VVLPISLAAFAALVWGSADYCGGRAAQRTSALGVTVASQIAGLPLLAVCLALLPGTFHLGDALWGAAAGAAGLFGIVLLYRGLSTGAMAVVAPITAVTGALIPMAVGLLSGEAPSALALGGVACAVVAIAVVSLGPAGTSARASTSVVGIALTAGAMFGIFFSLLAQVHDDAGVWPLAAVRAVSISMGLVLVARRGVSSRIPRQAAGWVVVAGIGDIGATALYLLATSAGLLSIVAPIAALYPVSTVLLALAVDKEHVRPIQVFGLGLAATSLVLTAV